MTITNEFALKIVTTSIVGNKINEPLSLNIAPEWV